MELQDYASAIRQLSKCIGIFPSFAEAYINRGLLYNKEKRWDKAVLDFHQAISIAPSKGSSYIGLAESLIEMGDYPQAFDYLEKALVDRSSRPLAFLKRGKIFFEQRDFQKALKDFDEVLEVEKENVEALYFRSLSLLGQEKLVDAGLCFEQVVKYNTSKKFSGAAIYNLGAIKIKQRDYYGAMFTFQRGSEMGVEIPEQKTLKNYVEAILMLVKRKFKEGVQGMTRIIQRKNSFLKDYIGNCYAYRGYGYAFLNKHEQARKDLLKASSIQELDSSSEYNLLVSTAVLTENKPEEALKLLSQALSIFPNNPEPKIYSAALNFQQACASKRCDLAETSKELLDEVVQVKDSESEVYFYRGIVLYFLGKYKEAIHDVELAIDKAEDNVVDHFIARGLCFGALKNYKEAIQNFGIAIQLNEKCVEAYYYRSRCFFLVDENESASNDIQKVLKLKNDDPELHIHAGDFLLLSGFVEKSLKAYSNALKLRPTPAAYIQRAKCFVMSENLSEAINELKLCSKIELSNSVKYDLEVLEILKNAHSTEHLKENLVETIKSLSAVLKYPHEGHLCNAKHVNLYRGVFMFFVGDIKNARNEFRKPSCDEDSDDETIGKESIQLFYNISVTYIFQENYDAALKHLSEVVYYLEGKERGKILVLMALLNLELGKKKDVGPLVKEAQRFDPELVQAFKSGKQELKILPLLCCSRYASQFPMAKICLGKINVLLKPSFSLPEIQLPKMSMEMEKVLLEKFDVKSIKCKPETPWMKRVKGSLQFTEDIQDVENESVAETEKSVDKRKDSSIDCLSDLREFKSESISMRENEKNLSDIKNLESSIEGIIDDLNEIDFY